MSLIIAQGSSISTTGRAEVTLDTRGATVIYIFGYGVFNVDGTPPDGHDSEGNVWVGLANPFSTCNGSTGAIRCFNPVTSAAHNFRVQAFTGSFEGVAFTTQIIVLAFAPTLFGSSYLHRNADSNKNPVKPGSINVTVDNYVMVTVVQAGCGLLAPTVDFGFSILETQPNLSAAYAVGTVPMVVDLTWTGLVPIPAQPDPRGASIVEGFGIYNNQPPLSSNNTRIYEA